MNSALMYFRKFSPSTQRTIRFLSPMIKVGGEVALEILGNTAQDIIIKYK